MAIIFCCIGRTVLPTTCFRVYAAVCSFYDEGEFKTTSCEVDYIFPLLKAIIKNNGIRKKE